MRIVQTLLLIFILPLSLARGPCVSFPSCLKTDITWEQSNVYDVVLNIATAENCQTICATSDTCVGFTWLSKESPIFPFGCGLFSQTGEEFPCNHCVSGAPECPCAVKGECVSQDDNIIQVL